MNGSAKCTYCGGEGVIATGPNDISDWDDCPKCKNKQNAVSREIVKRYVGKTSPQLQAIFKTAEDVVHYCDTDTGSDEFQLASAIEDIFWQWAEVCHTGE